MVCSWGRLGWVEYLDVEWCVFEGDCFGGILDGVKWKWRGEGMRYGVMVNDSWGLGGSWEEVCLILVGILLVVGVDRDMVWK